MIWPVGGAKALYLRHLPTIAPSYRLLRLAHRF